MKFYNSSESNFFHDKLLLTYITLSELYSYIPLKEPFIMTFDEFLHLFVPYLVKSELSNFDNNHSLLNYYNKPIHSLKYYNDKNKLWR